MGIRVAEKDGKGGFGVSEWMDGWMDGWLRCRVASPHTPTTFFYLLYLGFFLFCFTLLLAKSRNVVSHIISKVDFLFR